MNALKYLPLAAILIVGLGVAGVLLMPEHDPGGIGVPVPKPPPPPGEQERSLQGSLSKGRGTPSELTGSWPWFRGPDRDGINKDAVNLAREWPKSGPKRLWERSVGKGHAGVAIHKGCAYLVDYDEENSLDVIRAMSLETGEDIWAHSYPIKTKTNHGITRTVPAVSDRFVVTIGPKGQLYCLDRETGEALWSKSLVLDYGTVIPKWYCGQCPLLIGDKVVVAPSGPDAMLVQFDAETGVEEWRSPNPLLWNMTHSSVVPMDLNGRDTYVYSGSGGVAGVDASTGELLWKTTEWKISIAACASPLPVDHERIFLSAGYGVGSMMIKVLDQGEGAYEVEVLYALSEGKFGSVQHTPLLIDGVIYGIRPKVAELVCLNLDGSMRWVSGSANTFGIGPFMASQGLMYVLDDDGRMTLVELSQDGYKELARAQVLPGHDSWGPMAMADGLLIVRDFNHMVCLDLRAGAVL